MELKTLGIYGPYPKAGGSACSSYLVKTENAKLVLDFGSGALTRLTAEEDVGSVDAIILSHTHFDHVSDMLPLTYLMELRPGKLKVFLPKTEDNWYLKLLNKDCFEAYEVEAGDKTELNGAIVEFFAARHTVPTLGIKISDGGKSLYYTGDTVWFDELKEYVRGADAILADAAKPLGFKGPHMSYDKARLLKEASGGKVILTHLSPDFDPSSALNDSDITVAEEGKTYVI